MKSPNAPGFVPIRGFTLIERLVVIGLIGVMISLFQAPVSRAQEATGPVQVASSPKPLASQDTVSSGLSSNVPPLTQNLNRIWLLDVHNNNYLFRGPEPLKGDRIDFETLIRSMNQRLKEEKAPIDKLGPKFTFTDVALIGNRDEAQPLLQEYSTIVGASQTTSPPEKGLYMPPLDTSVTSGVSLDVTIDGTKYSITPSIVWQPLSGSKSETGVDSGNHKEYLDYTAPALTVVPASNTQPKGGAPNVTRVVNLLERYMSQPSSDVPNIIYFHCMNGHDRTGMVSTAYVLGTYGQSFGFNLDTAYKYGQMGTYLDPNDSTHKGKNYWSTFEKGELKPSYMNGVLAAYFFYSNDQSQESPSTPKLSTAALSTPLWAAGYQFSNDAPTYDFTRQFVVDPKN